MREERCDTIRRGQLSQLVGENGEYEVGTLTKKQRRPEATIEYLKICYVSFSIFKLDSQSTKLFCSCFNSKLQLGLSCAYY
jgi:hypothetical protein